MMLYERIRKANMEQENHRIVMCTKKTKSDTPGHSKNEYEEEEDRISDR